MRVNSNTRVANLNAATAGRADSAASADNATNAQNANTLDNKDSTEFANATHGHSGADITSGTVAEGHIDGTVTRDSEVMSIAKSNDGVGSGLDADSLDGKDSSQFIEGSGKVQSYAAAGAPGGYIGPYFQGGFFRVAYFCPSTLTNNGEVFFRNLAGEQINLFFDNGGTNPTYVQLANDQTYQPPGNASGEFVTYQVHSPTHGVATISVMTVHRANDCHIQAQAVVDK